jgi:ABC-type multidrug transport system ATPase subunit
MYLNSVKIESYTFSNSTFTLKNIDIKFERDLVPSIFPLCGDQGCGKSTLLRLVYDKLTTDSIHFDDGLKLQVDDTTEGGIHFVAQDLSEGVFPLYGDDDSYNLDSILYWCGQDLQGSFAQQKTEALLRYIADIKDSIILLDNPDLGLHPDQQYNLCRDIADLKTSNQFIVSTHSYEFCNVLTPRHAKILENTP